MAARWSVELRLSNTVRFVIVPSRGRPRDRAIDDAIIDATLELLVERGYARTSLRAVAERAGTGTPALYRRWPSKPDLVLDAVFRVERSEIVAATGDLRRDVSMMVRWALEKFGQPAGRAAFAGLLTEPGAGSDRLATVWAKVGERLALAIDGGELRSDLSVEELLSVLVGPAVMAVVLEGDAAVTERKVELFTDLVLQGVPSGTHTIDEKGLIRPRRRPPQR
jgi:AcrR family transcriptional regulator